MGSRLVPSGFDKKYETSLVPNSELWRRKGWEWDSGRSLQSRREEVGLSKELVECYKPYCWSSGELCLALQVFFIESVCNDPTVVASNVMVSMETFCFCFLL